MIFLDGSTDSMNRTMKELMGLSQKFTFENSKLKAKSESEPES